MKGKYYKWPICHIGTPEGENFTLSGMKQNMAIKFVVHRKKYK